MFSNLSGTGWFLQEIRAWKGKDYVLMKKHVNEIKLYSSFKCASDYLR